MNNQYAIVPSRDGKLHLKTPQGQHLQTSIQPQSEAAALFCQLIERVNSGNEAAIARLEQFLPQVIEAQGRAYETAIAAKDEHLSSLKEEVAYLRTLALSKDEHLGRITKAVSDRAESLRSPTNVTVQVTGGYWDETGFWTFATVLTVLVISTLITGWAVILKNSQPTFQPQGQGVSHERSI